MTLKMYIGNLLIDQYEFDFAERNTLAERSNYLQRTAQEMFWGNYAIVKENIWEKPVFFIDNIESKLNDIDFQEQTFKQIIYDHSEDTASAKIKYEKFCQKYGKTGLKIVA